jgi:hypothetical protein
VTLSAGSNVAAQKPKPAAEKVDPALAKARDQFRQAISMEAAKDWAGALALLREVAAVRNTAQVRYNIALCEENLGNLVAALGEYELAAADAEETGATEVTGVVGPRLESLRQRIPKLVVKRGKDATVAAISVDGVALGGAMVGKEMPINPGPHVIEAKASGFKPFKTSFEIHEKEAKSVEVVMEALPPEAVGGSTTGPGGIDQGPQKKKFPLVPVVVGGVGVASLIASGVFFGLRAGTTADLDDACGPDRNQCPADMKSTYDSGRMYNTVGNITLGVGAAGVVAGVVLYLTTGKSKPAAATVGIAPSPGGASVIGRF